MAQLTSLKIGDYVLATKYFDGAPDDHWYIGFYRGMLKSSCAGDRYMVSDAEGKMARATGFRKVKKITPERGCWLIKRMSRIESSGRSVWWWARQSMKGDL